MRRLLIASVLALPSLAAAQTLAHPDARYAWIGARYVGRPMGLAGLDSKGNMTAPATGIVSNATMDTPTVPAGNMLQTGRAAFTSMIDGQTIMRVTGSHRQDNPLGEDAYTDPDGVVIGGYAPGRGSHVVMTCQDEGGTNLGACLSIWNSNDIYTGNRPGISPTTGSQIANYINTLDSVVFDNGTKNTTPKIVSGPQVADSSGTTHQVFFTAGSVYVYPQLLASDEAKIKQFQTIVSNVSTPQYVNATSTSGYAFAGVNGFAGMVNNWGFAVPCPSGFVSGTCDRIDVDEWVIPGQSATDGAGLNPQSYAGAASNIDNHYDASVTQPTIYLGARSKQFNLLDTCTIVDTATAGVGVGPDSAHSLIRECENGEYDNELHTTISGKYHFNGLTIGLTSNNAGASWLNGGAQTDGFNAWPEMTSRGVYIGGQFPTLLQLEPFPSPLVWTIKGNTFGVTNSSSAASAPGSMSLASSLYKAAGSSTMREDHWEQCDAASGQTCANHSNMSWHIGLRVGSSTPESENKTNPTSGAAGSNLRFGGDGTLGVCQPGGGCAAVFSPTGSVTAPGYQEALTTPASSSAPCTAGQFTDDSNYHYVCVATNTWKRVALSTF